MGRLMAAAYDRFTQASERACLGQWRAELLGSLAGQILEVGAGTGLNIPHYPSSVSRLVLSEPDPHMLRKLATRARTMGWAHAQVVEASLEQLPLQSGVFDAVVATLVLCSVSRMDQALAEIHRVLRPNGHLVFIEHVAAEGRPRRLGWQRRVEPVWKRLMGNCHLTRRTADAIRAAGFTAVGVKRESMRKAWPLVRPTIRGVAAKGDSVQ